MALQKGTVFRYGRDVNTDIIIPARYMSTQDPKELAKYCMEDIDPEFVKNVKPGDIIVAEENFGCGSSREHAPISIKASGITCIIATFFARIFYRNAVNIGLPVFELPSAVENFRMGDQVEYDLEKGWFKNCRTGSQFQAKPFTPEIKEIFDAGGLIELVKQQTGR
ncbi:MAG: 3-isopropylmalate dehydratase small subunit [Candidatus Auribacterota bacterium]|jgi:3-isopropylmalate/(R)-2-methylmalate dehydratase small subunit|nr:3-isopropylmalate dehydratase small subunit [Candidatus Auribacterota bacterium]